VTAPGRRPGPHQSSPVLTSAAQAGSLRTLHPPVPPARQKARSREPPPPDRAGTMDPWAGYRRHDGPSCRLESPFQRRVSRIHVLAGTGEAGEPAILPAQRPTARALRGCDGPPYTKCSQKPRSSCKSYASPTRRVIHETGAAHGISETADPSTSRPPLPRPK
jgi:hypothetical protein